MAQIIENRASVELDRIIGNVKSKVDVVSKQGVEELGQYVNAQAAELPQERLASFQKILNAKLQEMFKGVVGKEGRRNQAVIDANRIAGTKCVLVLIDIEFMDPNLKITQFANYIYKALNTDIKEQAEIAASTLGKIVRIETALTHDIVEAEAKRCFEWLNDDAPSKARKYVGSLVLRELVEAVPHLLLKKYSSVVNSIWSGLRDDDIEVRRVAATALRAYVVGIIQRDSTEGEREFRTKSMEKLYISCMETIHCQEALCHGSLLALNELFTHIDGQILNQGFTTVCETVVKLKAAASSPAVRNEVVRLLPILATYNPSSFLPYLPGAMQLLLDQVRQGEKGAFTSIGKIIESTANDPSGQPLRKMETYITMLLSIITPILVPKAAPAPTHPVTTSSANGSWFARDKDMRKSQTVLSPVSTVETIDTAEAVACLKSIARAFPEKVEVRKKILDKDIQDGLFNLPLDDSLVENLNGLCSAIPHLLPSFQQRVLSKASCMLIGRPYDPYASLTESTEHVSMKGDGITKLQALQALQDFDLAGHDLTLYAARCCAPFLCHLSMQVRGQAAITCCKLLSVSTLYYTQLLKTGDERISLSHGIACPNSHSHKSRVLSILRSVISLGVSDVETENRIRVMKVFEDPCFDAFIATPECMRSLVLTINDEAQQVSEMGIMITGRLSSLNPACALPALRKVLLQLLTELTCTMDTQRQDMSAAMLGKLIRACPHLIEPYVQSLLKAIFDKLKDENHRAHGTLLFTLGELATVAGKEIKPFVPKIIPFIVTTLKDKPTALSVKQAVVALGKVMQSTGYIDVFSEHPKLLDFLVDSLQGASKEPFGTRLEIMKTFGIAGALDPHTVVQMRQDTEGKSAGGVGATSVPISDLNYDTHAVVNALLAVLDSPSQASHHRAAVQALQHLLKTLKTEKPVVFLPRILPAFLKLLHENITTDGPGRKIKDRYFAEFMFRAIGFVVEVVKQHIRKYQGSIVTVIQNFWDIGETNVLLQIINLCEELRKALNEEFIPYLTWLVPLMIQVVRDDPTADRVLSCRVMSALECFGDLLERYLHLTVPCLVTAFSNDDQPIALRIRAIRTLKSLCQQRLNLRTHAASIVHAIAKVLLEPLPASNSGELTSPRPSASSQHPPIHTEAIGTLEALLMNIKRDFEIFMPMVRRVLDSCEPYTVATYTFNPKDHLAQLSSSLQKIKQSTSLAVTIAPEMACAAAPSPAQDGMDQRNKPTVNPTTLKRAWQVSGASAAKDYVSWLSQFGQKLMQESPSSSLRSAFDISRQYPQLNYELFNVAFVSCYFDLTERHRVDMLDSVKKALQAENLPAEVLQPLLNLAEFMERCDRGGDQHREASKVNIMASFSPPEQLAALAERCQLYAKALHYHETSVRQIEASMKKFSSSGAWPISDRTACLEACKSLVHINNCLELPESSEGLLKYIQKHDLDQGGALAADMYENLGWWEKALQCYEDSEEQNPAANTQNIVGMFKCLDQLGDWPRLLTLHNTYWKNADGETKLRVAPMLGHAAWLMSKWDVMEEAVEFMPDERLPGLDYVSTTKYFYRAILAFHKNDREAATKNIETCRVLMDNELSTQIAESYSRAYELVVCLQQLSELEEVQQYVTSDEDRRATYRSMWTHRVSKMNKDPKYLQGTLAIRSLVMPTSQNINSWLDFVETCRWSGKMKKAQQVLMQLMGKENLEPIPPAAAIDDNQADPRVVLEYLKQLWVMNRTDKKYGNEVLLQLSTYAQRLGITSWNKDTRNRAPTKVYPEPTDEIKAKILQHTAMWQQQLQEGFWQPQHREGILNALKEAITYDPNGYQVWHEWALLNYRIPIKDEHLSKDEEVKFVTRAIEGFVRSISLCRPSELAVQDLLRLLRVWFNFGCDEEVANVVAREIQQVNVDMWLQVIPQIIARLDSREPGIRRTIHSLLCTIAARHPQAVTYPLVVCANQAGRGDAKVPGGERRRQCAQQVLEELRAKVPKLVGQAELVARELIRVAILWSEMWTDSLEEASRLYFGDRDPMGMIRVLSSLYEWLDDSQTDNERHFLHTFGRDLRDAKAATDEWKVSKRNNDMTQAWDLYYTVFKRLRRQLYQMCNIELHSVSPELYKVTDFEVAVPGQYQAGKVPVCIKSFSPTLNVIPSKQRPRKLTIIGSDGLPYKFLLKGHEDLRQDERVMQLFGLVNTLLRHDKAITKAARADLTIDQYPVIPLSSNVGIIGWLDRAETLHSLIRDYREKHKMQLNCETKFMQQHAIDYDLLSLMQKVEVFEYALAQTDGDDLNNILWLKASNSEVWLQRRTNFTRSLSVMSMVGYILGLGDRHPSNLMLDNMSGKVVHIDFGDCFEVAMQRDKFPEKIPFRLTRMLVRAMEVSGIEGQYRRTAELVMGMLRRNKDSLMAMLEAFVHDPLISWRLDTNAEGTAQQPAQTPLPNQEPTSAVDIGSFTGGPAKKGDIDRYSRSLHEKTLLRNRKETTHHATNKKAMQIIQRIKQKLDGTDFQDTHKNIRLTEEENIYANRDKKVSGTIKKKMTLRDILARAKKIYDDDGCGGLRKVLGDQSKGLDEEEVVAVAKELLETSQHEGDMEKACQIDEALTGYMEHKTEANGNGSAPSPKSDDTLLGTLEESATAVSEDEKIAIRRAVELSIYPVDETPTLCTLLDVPHTPLERMALPDLDRYVTEASERLEQQGEIDPEVTTSLKTVLDAWQVRMAVGWAQRVSTEAGEDEPERAVAVGILQKTTKQVPTTPSDVSQAEKVLASSGIKPTDGLDAIQDLDVTEKEKEALREAQLVIANATDLGANGRARSATKIQSVMCKEKICLLKMHLIRSLF
eukprot:TRINITY_DN13342_c0_g1_i3.p1 TRINITY_DN13342_c0_g1~~TRINITY_DN13342_c0_g1_i3.p1  ORF type:complete len:2822 (+),score=973.50 TRINITY_DN13342_c0_g1_i3:85-8550(+)